MPTKWQKLNQKTLKDFMSRKWKIGNHWIKTYFMSTKCKNQQLLNKNLFQVHRCVLIFLRVSTIAFKLITLLSWDLQNQFGVVYWASSYYKCCKLIESCFWREVILIQFAFHCSFYNQLFYENDFQGKQQKNKHE